MKHEQKRLSRRQFLRVTAGFLGINVAGCAGWKYKILGQKPLFKFGAVADIQYCDCEPKIHKGNYYRSAPGKLQECVRELNSQDLEFTIQLGDFINSNFESFDVVLGIYRQLKMPTYHVLGNHGFPDEYGHREVMAKLGMERAYYDFCVKGWRFIVLDGNDISLQAYSKGSERHNRAEALVDKLTREGKVNIKRCNGAIDSEQIAWLKKRLRAACDAGEKVIIFSHFGIWPQGKFNLWNDTEMLGIIEQYDCVKAHINGHVHEGDYGIKEGIHYLTMEGMMITPDTSAYAVIEVYPDFLKVDGYGRVPKRILEIR
jgi:hypothetical protein